MTASRLVPLEPTEAMIDAGCAAACKEDLRWNELNSDEVYAAMLAVVPSPPISEAVRDAVARQDRLHSYRLGTIFYTGEETLPCNPDDWKIIRDWLREQGVM